MSKAVKFSFILPAYKGKYLAEAISSILAQDYEDFELVVVDDCSPDSIYEIASGFNDNRISFFRNEHNIGGEDLVAQWNHCLDYSKGDYVILATDDDLYEPNFLSSFLPLIEKYPSADLFRARILQVNSNNAIKEIDRCYKEFLSPFEFRYHMMHGMKGGIPQYIFKRKVLMEKGGFVNFPKAWASDDATALMMAENGVVTCQEHLVRFRWSGINISSDKSCGVEKFKARLLFSQWLQEHPIEICCNEPWLQFYKNKIIDYLPIYNKVTLISTAGTLTWMRWLQCMKLLMACSFFSFKDKCSILLRSLQKRF